MTTIRDIARHAGVSIGTVSHVLNHPERVAPATRRKVKHAMQQTGWQPNSAAQTLRQRLVLTPAEGNGCAPAPVSS